MITDYNRYHTRDDDRLLAEIAECDPVQDFEAAQKLFTELLRSVDDGALRLPDDERLEQQVRSAWGRYESILEAEKAVEVLASPDLRGTLEQYPLLSRYEKFLATDRFLLEQCGAPDLPAPHLMMIGSGPLPLSSYIFGKSENGFGYDVTNVDTSNEALEIGQAIMDHAGVQQQFVHAPGAEVKVDPSVTGVIVAALAGGSKEEKLEIIENVSGQLQPGARMSVRYGTGVRKLFYPECVLTDRECEAYGLRRVGGFEPPREYMNAIGVYEKC